MPHIEYTLKEAKEDTLKRWHKIRDALPHVVHFRGQPYEDEYGVCGFCRLDRENRNCRKCQLYPVTCNDRRFLKRTESLYWQFCRALRDGKSPEVAKLVDQIIANVEAVQTDES